MFLNCCNVIISIETQLLLSCLIVVLDYIVTTDYCYIMVTDYILSINNEEITQCINWAKIWHTDSESLDLQLLLEIYSVTLES